MKTIGDLIKTEAKKQKKIKSIAEYIGVSEKNVYKILRNNDISTSRLKKISEVLNHNFFEDLAKDPDLAKISDEKELEQRALMQFWEFVPKILRDLNIEPILVHGRPLEIEEDIPLPEMMLMSYDISFTLGKTLEEKAEGTELKKIMEFSSIKNSKGDSITICTSIVYRKPFFDIAIICRNEAEWKRIIQFAIETVEKKNPNIKEIAKNYPFNRM